MQLVSNPEARPLARLNPLSVFAVCIAFILAAAISFDPIFQICVVGAVAAVLIFVQRVHPLLLAAYIIPFILFGMGFISTNLLFRQDSDFAIHLAGADNAEGSALSAGLTLSLRALACGMASIFFALTIEPGKFVRALIAYLKFPAKLGYALFVAMQMVPDILTESYNVRMAQAMREGRPVRRLPRPREVVSLVVPLLAFAIRRAGRSAIAMEARGFGARPARTMIGVPGFGWGDAAFVAAGFALLHFLLTRWSLF
jgi:energy-coupling factor transport system permease protein